MSDKTVKSYESDDFQKVYAFLSSVGSLDVIEEDIFDNAVIIIDDSDEVVGMISYEIFRQRALIRYFIFDKDLEEEYLLKMYETFFNNLSESGIDKVFVIIKKEVVLEMFYNLDFKEFDSNQFFLNEDRIENTKYKDSKVLYYQIS